MELNHFLGNFAVGSFMGILLNPTRDVFRRFGESLDVSRQKCRLLVPAYLFRGVPLAWGCTDCGKLFSRTIEEVLARPLLEAPHALRANLITTAVHCTCYAGRLDDPRG
jgi:hypothetical protein